MPARDPSRFGQCLVGFCRFGVYTKRWEQKLKPHWRDYTRRKRFRLRRNATTGWYEHEWVEDTIQGLLAPQGASLPRFASGVVQRGDGVFLCLAGMQPRWQIFDAESQRYWAVQAVTKHTDPQYGGLAYYECQLHYLELYWEGP